MCYVIKNNHRDENIRKMSLTDKKAIEIALLSEIPMHVPLSIIEIATHVWAIQSRDCYASEFVSITKIRRTLQDIILEDPRRIIETDIDEFIINTV